MVEFQKDLLVGSRLTYIRRSPEGVKRKELEGVIPKDLDQGKGIYQLYADFYDALIKKKVELKIVYLNGKKTAVLVLNKNYEISRDIDYFINPRDLSINSFIQKENGEIIVYNKVMSPNLRLYTPDLDIYLKDPVEAKNIEIVQKVIIELKEKLPNFVRRVIANKLKKVLRPRLRLERRTIKPKMLRK